MTDSNTTFLDLDSVVPDKQVVIKLAGEEHKLVPVTVKGFVENTKKLEAFLKKELKTTEDEVQFAIDTLLTTFPTMTAEMLHALDLFKLNKLVEFAQSHNGTKQVQDAVAEETKPDPQTAG